MIPLVRPGALPRVCKKSSPPTSPRNGVTRTLPTDFSPSPRLRFFLQDFLGNENLSPFPLDPKAITLLSASESPTFVAETQETQSVPLLKLRKEENPPLYMILGGTGQMAGLLARQIIENDENVILTSRSGPKSTDLHGANVDWMQTPNPLSEAVWAKTFKKALLKLKPEQKLCIINTMGGVGGAFNAGKQDFFHDLNVKPTTAAVRGLMLAAKELNMVDRIHFTHISSIAAGEKPDGSLRVPDDEYSTSRTLAEQNVLATCKDNARIFRMGYGFKKPEADGEIINDHAYSMDQLPTFPVQPIIGNGKQPFQPIAMEDAIVGILRNHKHNLPQIIEGVGEEIVTQEQATEFFCNTLGTPFRPVYISAKALHQFAKIHPKGHLCAYAVKYLLKGGLRLDSNALAKVVEAEIGRKPLRLRDIYSIRKNQKLIVKLPVGEIADHCREIVQRLRQHPNLIQPTLKAGLQILFSARPTPPRSSVVIEEIQEEETNPRAPLQSKPVNTTTAFQDW